MAVPKHKLTFWLWVTFTLFVLLSGALVAALTSDAKTSKPSISCCGSKICAEQKHHSADKPADPILVSNRELKAWYDSYNEVYFMNQLPQDTEVRWDSLAADGKMGLSTDTDGEWLIRLDRYYHPSSKWARLTLLHEMCHVSVNHTELDQHGDKFQNCMIRLAGAGAMKEVW